MRSAYGRQTPPPDYELTSVEPGSPMGELLRRYWQPVCTSDELRDLPKKVKLLCEELVVFRDKKGRAGALEPHCSHRGTSLEWGRIEERGIRCCYHGWLYDTQGQCIEMPCETAEFCKRMDVWHPAYPTLEYGGLAFVYGPARDRASLPDVRQSSTPGTAMMLCCVGCAYGTSTPSGLSQTAIGCSTTRTLSIRGTS
ncbi:MAG: Rieske 2Fe-2S domain-containing protein [Stellaceae bacterium]